MADSAQRDAFQDESELLSRDSKATVFIALKWQFIGALFQSLVIEGKAVAFKEQQLYLVAPFGKEDKYRSAQGIEPQLSGYQAAERIEALAHIGSTGTQIISAGRGKVQHRK